MDVLFSPFRPRKVNPENYDGKLKFWKDMIVRFCNEKGSPCVCQRELKWAFRRKDKLPCAVETVMADLVASKTLRPQSDFINDPQNTWSGWLVNSFVRKPLQWGLPRFQAPTEPQDVQYIHLDVLKSQSKDLKKILEKFAGTVVTFDKISETQGVELSKEGLFINLLNLQSMEKVYLEFKVVDGQRRIYLVKIPEKHSAATPITDADKAIFALEQTEADLLQTMEEIETEVVKFDRLARENVRQGKRVVAKSYLRKKHKWESNLEKHSKALDNVQTLLARIHDTRGNESILDAYSIGSKTLKSLLSSSKLNTDSIDEVVDTIKETLEIHDEVEQSISSVQPMDKAEEQALEQELQNLMLDNVSAANDKEDISVKPEELPAVPTSTVQLPPPDQITDQELLKHLESLQIELGSLSSDNIVEDNKI